MKITKMHSLVLAGAGLLSIPFVHTGKNTTIQPISNEKVYTIPKDGTIYEQSFTKCLDASKLNIKSTTYLKNKSAISLLSKIK